MTSPPSWDQALPAFVSSEPIGNREMSCDVFATITDISGDKLHHVLVAEVIKATGNSHLRSEPPISDF